MIPLWNTWYFFALYANAARSGQGYAASASTASADVLDRYLLAKLREFVETMTISWTPTRSPPHATPCAASSTC
jgi:isoleucyl-tRNA synthetase